MNRIREWLTGLVHLGREKLVPIVLTLAILLVQWKMKWIQSGDGWTAIVIRLLLPLGFFLAFYAVRAVVQLDKRKAEKITALEMVLKEWPKRVELIKLLRGYHREGELLKEELEQIYELKKAMDEAGALVASDANQER